MDSFEAESKRTWFTIRDSLRHSTKGGRLWIPAVVTPVDGWIRIHTSDEAVEFRPRRLRWIDTRTLVVAGIGLRKGRSFQRSYLRFKTLEEATKAARIIKHNPSVLEEPLVPLEEFPVQLKLLLTARSVILLLYVTFVNILVGSFLFLALSTFGVIGAIAGLVALIGYGSIPVLAALRRTGRRSHGSLRIQGTSIVVRGLDWMPIIPRTIEWRSPRVIVLEGRGAKYELSFSTTQDLTRAVTKIRVAFPQVHETLAETYVRESP